MLTGLLLLTLSADAPRPVVAVAFVGEGGWSPDYAVSAGGGVELVLNVMRYGRIVVDTSAAWAPPLYGHESMRRGVVRGMVGAEAVLPLRTVDLFAGIGSGFNYSNVNSFSKLVGHCYDCGPFNSSLWLVSAALRVRAGVDWYAGRRLTLGFALGYGLVTRFDMHWVEAAARVGITF